MTDLKFYNLLPVLSPGKATKRMVTASNSTEWTLVFCTSNEDVILSCSAFDQYKQESITALPTNLIDAAVEKNNIDFSVNDIVQIQDKDYIVNSLSLGINNYGLHMYIILNEA